MLPWVPVDKPIDAHLDACATCAITEGVDPVAIDLGHLNAHRHSVSHILQVSSATCVAWGRTVIIQSV